MQRTQRLIHVAAIAVFAAWGTSAHAASIQFDFGTSAGIYSGTVAPAHAAGALGGSDTTWNGIAATSTNNANFATGLKYTDGTVADGVTMNFWRSTNFSFPIRFESTFSATGLPTIYDTELAKDALHYNSNIGVRVQGLAAGTYNVYAIVLDLDNMSTTYTVGVGVGVANATISLSDPVITDTTVINPAILSGVWADGENFALSTVTTNQNTDYINVLISPSTNPGRIVGLQIVQVPEPVSTVLFGISGLMLIGRRRRSA